jgi:hypothetical protein
VSVETAKDPVQAWDFDRGADAGINCGLIETPAIDGESLPSEEGDITAKA